jgi:hypothetical protein
LFPFLPLPPAALLSPAEKSSGSIASARNEVGDQRSDKREPNVASTF